MEGGGEGDLCCPVQTYLVISLEATLCLSFYSKRKQLMKIHRAKEVSVDRSFSKFFCHHLLKMI